MVIGQLQKHIAYSLEIEFDLHLVGALPLSHCAINWSKKDSINQLLRNPRGISGAPVWGLDDPFAITSSRIVGVFIAYHKKYDVAVFTPIDLVAQFIDMAYQS